MVGVGASIGVIFLVLAATGPLAESSSDSVEESPPTTVTPPRATRPKPPPEVAPRFEILEERTGRDAMMGYYVWCLVEPMTEPQLKAFGHQLLERMRAAGGDHLKAWLFYNRDDYDPLPALCSPCVVWLNATGPDYELVISGPIPGDRTTKACYEAYVEGNGILSSHNTEKALVWCEFDEKNMSLTYHDRLASTSVDPLSVEDIVLYCCNGYLPGRISPSAWVAIPGLKRVIVHLYEKGGDELVITLQYDKRTYERTLPLYRALWELRAEMEKRRDAAEERHRALLITAEEYRATEDAVAEDIFGLYEELWIELSSTARIQAHKPIPHAPLGRLREYFFDN
jgi:hypothetical protein